MIIRINNIDLNYELVSPTKLKHKGTVLVFLHEALGSIPQWKSFPKELCERVGLNGIVYERQGHGASSPFDTLRDKQYLHNYALNELPKFISATIGEDQNIILVGHSDGGSIALLHAHHFPDRIAGVVTMAAHVINEPETIAGISPAVEAFKTGKLKGLEKYHGAKTNDLFYAWANIWRDESFLHWDITKEIGSDCPYLSIQGADDQYGTIKQLELLNENTGADIHLLDKCGHHPHLEQREVCVVLISTFISLKVLS